MIDLDLTERMARAIEAADALTVHPEGHPGKLKSGKESYIFYNFGDFYYPDDLWEVACCFADRIVELGLHEEVDFIFGPAYKGIGLAVAISLALWQRHEVRLPFCSDRKEEKKHGEGGKILNFQPTEGMRSLIIDDVLTMGDAKEDAKKILDALGVIVVAILVGVDRSDAGVIERLQQLFEARVLSVTTHEQLKDHFMLPDYATY